jgi:hypothetical protein
MEAEIDASLLQRALRGRPVEEAVTYLQSLPAEVDPVLEVEPAWMVRVPWFPFRISVVERASGEPIEPA